MEFKQVVQLELTNPRPVRAHVLLVPQALIVRWDLQYLRFVQEILTRTPVQAVVLLVPLVHIAQVDLKLCVQQVHTSLLLVKARA
jgi:hypothetical protein